MKLYRGYISLSPDTKKPTMKWNRDEVPDAGLLTIEQASVYRDYGAPLERETALIDIDERAPAEKLFTLVKAEGIRCRVIQTDRGLHFLFANRRKTLLKCATKVRFAVGLAGDIKVGVTNSYEKLKSHGDVRECIWNEDLTDTDQLDDVPAWLRVIGRAKDTVDFPSMQEGDGRNTELYNLSYSLQRRGFDKDDVEMTCRLLNSYIFDEPLPDDEFRLVTREESMKVPPIFDDDDEDLDEERIALGEKLDCDKKGNLLPTINNVMILLKRNPAFDGIRKNILSDVIEAGDRLPWRRNKEQIEWTDDDDSMLRAYMEHKCNRFTKSVVFDGLNAVANERMYHPVRDYLEGLPEWDGVERADRLLVTFLGADDTEYVHQVTRKTLCAAIRRIYEPGCKFDTLLVLNGPQGLGKSTLIRKLAEPWFGDSLLLSDICYNGKAAAEKIQGIWIEEIAELSGLKKVDIETLRGFITRQDDYGRAAYGRRSVHRPRQCVFFGTTNAQQEGFLRDTDGNRRFWVVDVADEGGERSVVGPNADLSADEIKQIWAEIKVRVAEGEALYITDAAVLEEAQRIQNRSIEEDPRQNVIDDYLQKLLPEDWYSMSEEDRENYFKYDNGDGNAGTKLRQYVTYRELWTEALGNDVRRISRIDRNDLKAMMLRLGWHIEKKAIRLGGKASKVFARNEVSDVDFH